jgi:predicted phosphohydrolase
MSRKLRLQIISDIHLEFLERDHELPIIQPKANILCLLGDIGNPKHENYWEFLSIQSKNFSTIFLITGNHEYYGSSIEETNSLIVNTIKSKSLINIVFLNNGISFWENTIILGTTLWSHIPKENEEVVTKHLSDYRCIDNFTTDISNTMFIENVKWIESILEKYPKHEIIVLSHHTPLLYNVSSMNNELKSTNCAFSSDLSKLLPRIKLYAYGHTHYNHKGNSFKYHNTTLVCNQRGYPSNVLRSFIPDFVYEYCEDE